MKHPLYLSGNQLKALNAYKYSGIDRSLTSKYILNPFWEWLILQFPLTMAPNLITLIGLLFMISATILAIINANYESSSILFAYVSFCIATYLNMDAIDGKQARRTGTSGPLGELFDHGCDAINMMLMSVLIPLIFGLTSVELIGLMTIFGYAAFYAATWEEFHTGTLFLDFISGPVEGAWSLVICALVSAACGVSVWETKVPGTEVAIKNFVPIIFIIGSVSSIHTSFKHSLVAESKSNTIVKATIKSLLRELLPVSLYFASCIALLFLLQDLSMHWFIFFTGFPACFRISSTILAHITKQKHLQKYFYPTEFFPILACALSNTQIFPAFIKFGTLISVIIYALAMQAIIIDICTHLNINCLTIKEKNEAILKHTNP